METPITVQALNEAALEIGKAAIYRAGQWDSDVFVPQVWDGTSTIEIAHIGDTEGPVVFNAQEQTGVLRLPEVYGPGKVKAWAVGAEPTMTAPLFMALPELRSEISPTGDGQIGRVGRIPAKEHTIVVFPRALFFNPITGRDDAEVRYTDAAGWEKSAVDIGDAPAWDEFSADDDRLIGLSIWIWNGYWDRPDVTYEATVQDVIKNIEECVFNGMPNFAVRGGLMASIGDPAEHNIDIDPQES